jgi:hypothetical protein
VCLVARARLCIQNEEKLAQRMQILREREFDESARANAKKMILFGSLYVACEIDAWDHTNPASTCTGPRATNESAA